MQLPQLRARPFEGRPHYHSGNLVNKVKSYNKNCTQLGVGPDFVTLAKHSGPAGAKRPKLKTLLTGG